MNQTLKCRHADRNPLHNEEVVVKVWLKRGCACFPNDKEQWLCEHHFMRLEENGALDDYGIIELAPGVTYNPRKK